MNLLSSRRLVQPYRWRLHAFKPTTSTKVIIVAYVGSICISTVFHRLDYIRYSVASHAIALVTALHAFSTNKLYFLNGILCSNLWKKNCKIHLNKSFEKGVY